MRSSTPSRLWRPRPALLAASTLIVVLAACGSDSKSSDSTAAATTVAAATTTPTTEAPTTTEAPATTEAAATTEAGSATSVAAGEGTPVVVDEKEFSIGLPETSFAAGTYTFDITNSGQFKHNLIVEGNGDKATSDTYNGGESGSLTVTLKPGTYEVYCGIPTHKDKGMDMTITVT